MDELRDRIAQALSVPDVHHPDFCDCGQPVCGGTCYAEGEDCYCAAERCNGLEQQIDAVLTLLQHDQMERALRAVLELAEAVNAAAIIPTSTPIMNAGYRVALGDVVTAIREELGDE